MNARRLDRLAASLNDGTLTADEADELEALIASDAALRERFVRHRLLHGMLTDEMAGGGVEGPRAKTRGAHTLPLALAAALLLAVGGVAFWPRPTQAARLGETSGEVRIVSAGGEGRVGTRGDAVRPGQEVHTAGGHAVVEFADGSRAELGEDTIAAMQEGSALRLEAGLVSAEVAADRVMRVSTAHAVMEARGGRFASSALPDGTHVEVEAGDVRLTAKSDGKPMTVEPGSSAGVGPRDAAAVRSLGRTHTKPARHWPGSIGHVRAMAFSAEGTQLATVGYGGEVEVRDAASGASRVWRPFARNASAVAFADRLLIGGEEGRVRVYEGEEHRFDLPATTTRPLAFAAARGVAALGYRGAERKTYALKVFDLASGQEAKSFTGRDGPFTAVALSPDGRRVAAGTEQGTLFVWRWRDGEPVRWKADARRVRAVAIAPQRDAIAVLPLLGAPRLYDASGRPGVALQPRGGEFASLAFSPDGKYLMAVGEQRGRGATVWDAHTGEVVCSFRGTVATLACAAFGPDGGSLFTGGRDGVRVWPIGP